MNPAEKRIVLKPVVGRNSAYGILQQIQQVERTMETSTSDNFGTPSAG